MKLIARILMWAAPGVGGVINPWVLIAAGIAAAVIFGAGSAAGWTANGWRLGTQLEKVKGDLAIMTTQAQVCATALQTQNESADALGKLGELIQGGTRATLDAIELGAAGQRAELGRLRVVLGKPTPTRPDGSKFDCNDAWREIEQRRAQP